MAQVVPVNATVVASIATQGNELFNIHIVYVLSFLHYGYKIKRGKAKRGV